MENEAFLPTHRMTYYPDGLDIVFADECEVSDVIHRENMMGYVAKLIEELRGLRAIVEANCEA